jgi:hypothetical protein
VQFVVKREPSAEGEIRTAMVFPPASASVAGGVSNPITRVAVAEGRPAVFSQITLENWRMKKLGLVVLSLVFSMCAYAQQNYVGRYDSFVGFTYLDTPRMNLMERGFITQEGINLNRWLAFGFDFSAMKGHSFLTIGQLVPADRAAAHHYGFPDSFGVPYNSTTFTYTAGPQINIRKFRKFTLFVHPSLGAIHETVTGDPKTPLQTELLAALVPGGSRSDTTYFYGAGGGLQYGLTQHFGLRFTADFVHVYLFSDFLADSRNTFRFGVGPTFNFGKNVK